jgi:hypothetical protein
MRAGRVFVLTVIAFLPAAASLGASPPPAMQIRLIGPADGFVPVAEVVTPGGAVIDTFVSGDVTVRVIGSPGSTIRARNLADRAADRGGVALELSTTRPKRLDDADAYGRAGRSVVGDLVALGMPEDEARRQFGDLETLDPAAGAGARLVTSAAGVPALDASMASAGSATATPYDTQCASVSYQGGLIEGYGCSTIYLVAAKGSDWWFNNKYKFSARSKDPTNIFCIPGTCPWRLIELGWALGWTTGNILYDWEPSTTLPRRACSGLSIGDSFHGVDISISGTVCPDRLQPWNLTSRRSGAEWIGLEQGTAWESAIGIQAIHSPPGAAAAYSSPLSLYWARWNT